MAAGDKVQLLGFGTFEAKERKYDKELHRPRLEIILEHWNEILAIIDEELPSSSELEGLLVSIGSPLSVTEIGLDEADLPTVFRATKDIRDKYVLSRLCHDLGIIDEIKFCIEYICRMG